MRAKQFLRSGLFLVAIGSSLFAGLNLVPGTIYNIWIDAGKPFDVKAPFEIAEINDIGRSVLRIGPDVGRGWCGEAGGEALYSFEVPDNGIYYVWALCLWHDSCTNAVYAEIGQTKDTITGDDAEFNRQYWDREFNWLDVCTGYFYKREDRMKKAIIGNDPIFNQWHWVSGLSIYLEHGTHILRLSNHSDNISMQKLFLTNSPMAGPIR